MIFFFQAEDGIRDLVRSRGLGDVYKRQSLNTGKYEEWKVAIHLNSTFTSTDELLKYLQKSSESIEFFKSNLKGLIESCLLYTSDAADERSSVDLGGRRIIKKKKSIDLRTRGQYTQSTQLEQHISSTIKAVLAYITHYKHMSRQILRIP
mgnify:CR=1 FL=1